MSLQYLYILNIYSKCNSKSQKYIHKVSQHVLDRILATKELKKIVKVCLHSSQAVQISIQFYKKKDYKLAHFFMFSISEKKLTSVKSWCILVLFTPETHFLNIVCKKKKWTKMHCNSFIFPCQYWTFILSKFQKEIVGCTDKSPVLDLDWRNWEMGSQNKS